MQCQICGKAPATVHYTEIVNDKITELHVCEKCAEERGLHGVLGQSKVSISGPLVWMMDSMSATEEDKVGGIQCPVCGMKYSTFKETARVGCAACYEAFRAQLRPVLRRVHGSTRHSGKSPSKDGAKYARRREIQKLQEELDRAIQHEEFEMAAELRDKIRKMEAALAGKKRRGTPKAE
ncbi:MAG: UvrB/UvrC motif-containing protein [Candidatus Eisenbacteria bacterium]|nr:UvrB/UvrC motif-containing protein [Candidatus Eisenbacteria bacterium]